MGSVQPPMIRRTNDILRIALAAVLLATVVTSSLMIRDDYVIALERSISGIVGLLSPGWSEIVYRVYGGAVMALPVGILVSLLIARRWKVLQSCAGAGLVAVLTVWVLSETSASQFFADPRWIALLAAVLTVSGPWLSAPWRRWSWALLLAFAPVHLVVSAVVPAGSLLGLSVGWIVGAVTVWLFGTPTIAVPLEGAVGALARRGFVANELTVLQPAGPGPLVLRARSAGADSSCVVELYDPNQSSGTALQQVWRLLRLRATETAPLQTSLHRFTEHRALVAIAVADAGLANTTVTAFAALDRGWLLYAHTPADGTPITECPEIPVVAVWEALGALHCRQIAHGDLRGSEITVADGSARFGGFEYAELGTNEAQFHSDIAQLLLTTCELAGAERAVGGALDVFGKDTVLAASRRLTKSALPKRIRQSLADLDAAILVVRNEVMLQTGTENIQSETITRFSRNQIIQLVLLVAFVYVAYPLIGTLPTFFSQLTTVNWWWASLGLAVSALTYVGAAAALWACASKTVSFRRLAVVQVANTVAAVTTPASVGGLALSARFLQKSGLGATRATAAVALQEAVQVITHIGLLAFFSVAAGTSSRFVPSTSVLYLIVGVSLGLIGILTSVPRLRRWLGTTVRPRLMEVAGDLLALAREPRRLVVIVVGCAATTLGGALALWASIEALGGSATFVTVTVVTMIGGTLASAAPTPGGVGAVEAALIGGLAAFGIPAAVGFPAVLLYRVLTCWLPAFVGWPVMRWLTANDMI